MSTVRGEDLFGRPNEAPLGFPWASAFSGAGGMNLYNGQVTGATNNTGFCAMYYDLAMAGSDGWVKCRFSTADAIDNSEGGVIFRSVAGTTKTFSKAGYGYYLASGGWSFLIDGYIGGVSISGPSGSAAPTAPDDLEIRFFGNILSYYLNGSWRWDDNTMDNTNVLMDAGVRCGLYSMIGTYNTPRMDTFEYGDYAFQTDKNMFAPGILYPGLGTIQSKTANQSSLALVTGATAAAGRLAWVTIAVDNATTTDGDGGAVSSITDTAGGNTWTKAIEFQNGQGSAQAGAVVSIWYSILVNQINRGGTITANFTSNTSRDAAAMAGDCVKLLSGYDLQVYTTMTGASDGVINPGDMTLTVPAGYSYLFVTGLAVEAPETDAHIPSGNIIFPAPQSRMLAYHGNGTTGGAAASNMLVRTGYRIGDHRNTVMGWINGFSNSRDDAMVAIAFRAVPNTAPGGSTIWGGLGGWY